VCGALVRGVDLRDEISQSLSEQLREVWLQHHVIAFPDQQLTIEDLERVALAFGPYGVDPYITPIAGHPHVIEVKREADETSPVFAEGWHSDWSFLDTPPAGTLLYGVVIPPVGGDTLYADQHAAYDALDHEMKRRLDGLMGIHSARRGYAPQGAYGEKDAGRSMTITWSDEAMATQLHPLVRAHPETGRLGLFLSLGYTIGIEGMEQSDAQELLVTLYRHQSEDRFVYRHRWSAGMATLWDNRSVIHAATGGYQGHHRLLWRITVAERS
jgi:taurine dioxygenase